FTSFYHTFKTKIKIGKICNMKIIEDKMCFTEKKQDLVFKKPFSKRYIWKKGGRLIIRVVLYSGQYGKLAFMDDVNRLVNVVDAGYSGSVWIGLKRGKQTRWVWSDGENTTSQYYNWASGQPNEDGFCTAIFYGAWHDVLCDLNIYFVCYGEFLII
uniref:C-type lectin domain-containing protein n=1 Tax=Sinocyclocheilus rhinocerous TaxID=307959 RepID=A0A673HAT5_9TELE